MNRKIIGILVVCLFIGSSFFPNFNNCVTAPNSSSAASVKMDDVVIDCEGGTTYAYLHAKDIAEHVGSGTIALRFDPDEISIVSVDDSEFDSLFYTIVNDTLYLLGTMGSSSYLTGDFNITRIGFIKVGKTGCSLEILSSELLTDDPMPIPITHITINGYATIDCNIQPDIPNNPSPFDGAIDVNIDTILYWSCSDPNGDDLTYDVYFGSIPPFQKIASNISTTTIKPGALAYGLTYFWRVVAWDNHGLSTNSPEWDFTTINATNNPPNKPSKPSGITLGKTGRTYSYSTSTTDPNDDNVYYWFDWGDGTNSSWDGPHISGDSVTIAHAWVSDGSYPIKVKTKDVYDAESVWSDPLVITMPKNKSIEHPIISWLFEKLIQRFPIIEKILNQLL